MFLRYQVERQSNQLHQATQDTCASVTAQRALGLPARMSTHASRRDCCSRSEEVKAPVVHMLTKPVVGRSKRSATTLLYSLPETCYSLPSLYPIQYDSRTPFTPNTFTRDFRVHITMASTQILHDAKPQPKSVQHSSPATTSIFGRSE